MVVYVEYVFLDNFIIDVFLVILARKGFKLEISRARVFVSAIFGAIVAVILPTLKLQIAFSFALKMPIGLIIVLLSGKFRNFKEYVKCFYLFLFFTFLLGGVVTAVFWGLNLSFDPINYAHGSEIPLFLILLVLFLTYLFTEKIIKEIYKRKNVCNFLMRCQIEMQGKTFELLGFLDSGNSLYHKETQSPIILCSKKSADKLKDNGAFLGGAFDVVSVKTVAGTSLIPIYKIQKILIYNGDEKNILYNVMLGVAKGGFSGGEEYDLLLSPLVCKV